MVLLFDYVFFEELNDYFGELCLENIYMVFVLIEFGEDYVILEIIKW